MTDQLAFPTAEADALRATLGICASHSSSCQRDVSQALELYDEVRNHLVSEDDRLRSAAWVLHAEAVKCLTFCAPPPELTWEHVKLRLAAEAFRSRAMRRGNDAASHDGEIHGHIHWESGR
jgi:hypothetical protein